MAVSQVVALALAFSSLASALPGGILAPNPAYQYSYGVADAGTGDRKSASESSSGGVTKGSYSFVQPDGITRTVNYIADPINGFQAQVLNNGVDVTGRQAIAAGPAIVAAAPAVVAAPIARVAAINPWADARWTGPLWLGPAGQETPEVAAARAAHLAAHAQAIARNSLGNAAPLVVDTIANTPEVSAARAAHLAAVAEARARNAALAPLGIAPWGGLGWSG